MNKKLLLIFLLSLVLRIYLSSYPPLLWDEAALGYNAYSILKTGRDEYGKLFPLIFKSFGDYKPGLYVYLSVPFIALLGLNQLAVRLPSILLGSFTPILLYFLIIAIDPKRKKIATFSAFLLAITPFHIHFSRGAWETNIFTFQLVLASLLFTKYINSKKLKSLLFSSLIFGLSLYTYQSAKMTSLLIIFLLFIQNLKTIIQNSKKILLSFIFPLAIIALPIGIRLLVTTDSNRLQILSTFSYPRTEIEQQQLISYSSPFKYQLFNGNIAFFIRSTLSKYQNHLSPNFLFFKGDWQNPRHSAIYTGVLLLSSILFLPIGFLTFKSKLKTDRLFLIWLLIAPIPSALTRDTVSAVRSASLVIPLTYFTAKGIVYFSKFFKNYKVLFYIILLTSYSLSFAYYFELYFNHTVKTHPTDYLYGYNQAISYLSKNQSKYKQVYFSNFYGQPYIYYLFFTKYPPKDYQSIAHLSQTSIDTGTVDQIGNIHFFSPDASFCLNEPDTLCIFSTQEKIRNGIYFDKFGENINHIGNINNQTQFYAYPKN